MKSRIVIWVISAAFLCTTPQVSAKTSKTHTTQQLKKNAPRKSRQGMARTPNLQQEQMLNDLGFIKNIFQVTYAPMEWKQQHLGWSLDNEIAKAKLKVMRKESITTKEFQSVVRDLCGSVQDHHVHAEFYSTEEARLPFSIQSAEGKYFISDIVQSDTETEPLPFSIGDEVISFNGQPIGEAVEAYKRQTLKQSYSPTDQALAEMYFTRRYGDYGDEVPQGSVTLLVRQASSGQLVAHDIEWDYCPEGVSNAFLVRSINATAPQPRVSLPSTKRNIENRAFFHQQFATPIYEKHSSMASDENEPSVGIGAKKNTLPSLGEVLWEAPEKMSFYAYLFSMPGGKKGGYVRIPTYYLDSETAAEEFAEIIHLFEEDADVLVIDQLNNPGGNLLFLYALLSMLTDRPLEVPQHRAKITQENVYSAFAEIGELLDINDDMAAREALGDTIRGYPVDYELVQSLLTLNYYLINQWNEGKVFTDFHYLFGIETIRPNPIAHYSKPILLLVNSLDFSCGDFLPAILQDNQRATIMGSRTAGAGGYTETVAFPNLNGLSNLVLTASFAQRGNGLPIEDLGVTPDIPYEVSALDLQNHYVEYVDRILEELTALMQ